MGLPRNLLGRQIMLRPSASFCRRVRRAKDPGPSSYDEQTAGAAILHNPLLLKGQKRKLSRPDGEEMESPQGSQATLNTTRHLNSLESSNKRNQLNGTDSTTVTTRRPRQDEAHSM
jgi:hypothetical protein